MEWFLDNQNSYFMLLHSHVALENSKPIADIPIIA